MSFILQNQHYLVTIFRINIKGKNYKSILPMIIDAKTK